MLEFCQMSPEFRNWHDFKRSDVPSETKDAIATHLEERSIKEKRNLIDAGFAFAANGKRISRLVDDLARLSDSQRSDAKKQTSHWHVVLGIKDSLRGEKIRQDKVQKSLFLSSEYPVLIKSHRNVFKHRGKHRSTTKGAGIMALFRGSHRKGI